MTEREEFEKWFDKQLENEIAFTSDEFICKKAWQQQQQRLALKDLEIMRLRKALESAKVTMKSGVKVPHVGGSQYFSLSDARVEKALSTPTTYDDLMAWHEAQLGENCALLTIREQLEPKIDILFSGINKLPIGLYNLIPIKKDK